MKSRALSFLVSFSLIASTSQVFGMGSRLPATSGSSESASLGTPDSSAPKISSEEAEKIYLEGALQYFVLEYQYLKSPAEFENRFLQRLSKADHETFRKTTQKAKQLPRITTNGSSLTLNDGKSEIVIKVIDRKKSKFTLNGVEFIYQAQMPLDIQIKNLQSRLNSRKSAQLPSGHLLPSALLYQSILEPASAEPITAAFLITIAISTIIGALLTGPVSAVISRVFCDLTSRRWRMSRFELCTEWEANRKKEAEAENSVKLDAVEKMLALENGQNVSVLPMFDTLSESPTCLAPGEGKDRIYRGRIKIKDTQQDVDITAIISADGPAKSLEITDPVTKKNVAILTFGEGSTLKCAAIPNEVYDRNPTPITSRTVSLCNGQTKSGDEKATLELLRNITRYTSLRIVRCTLNLAASRGATNLPIGEDKIVKAPILDTVQPPPPPAPGPTAAPPGTK